ncbi:MAG: CDP-alcohol phosphatidyltransferase family protein [Desulfobacterales bacterium]|nr:MAG: CDP-alcohol phosphatidyltransferase family protein [Desulfobacterales bacterium]
MTFPEIREKCRRKSDYILTLFFTNEIALLLTWMLFNTRVTPNQVTLTSIFFGLLCALSYAQGAFLPGSVFLFFSHVLDCTDGNLARAREEFSPTGKWLDMIGDRFAEALIFIGIAIHFLRVATPEYWILLSLIDAILLSFYYYIVDISLAMGLSKPLQNFGGLKFKNVHVKWGVLEPVVYGFIFLPPLGFVKLQLVLVFIVINLGIGYQVLKKMFSKM